ncbi:F-box/WD-40 repeat-containing protein At3g52030 [Phalaenopsis equestris]|uniref:F-box/WD-40 repeat-containing protein At3g52030 n=1 Tax=Phalaenopsis equestris TaxID=78828 RepID=UPI0009E62EB3|nr:F-box/WD-40 repeat-containing protein At3g52030 [Phalaenopsis equestris]XP_020589022.1 F-box/WD-40 repeat-containing protein At3g52030 [Phalaenopsis equestris]XP_020589030.1 F-box/WD-40 repeat-containing protein At3g52030 [Phalaenopsis equestris]XP_020589038.1 F-box/WD-40 repeat-containing protein At3g52030 [Phalaenopsis equestris]
MESSSRSVTRSAASHGGGKRGPVSSAPSSSIHSLSADLLGFCFSRLDPSELVRCAVVCKLWNKIIYSSTLMRDLYEKISLHGRSSSNLSVPVEASMKRYFEKLALEQHRLSFLGSSSEVHQWRGHSSRIDLCRLRRGLILSGAEDKVMRLWSAESCKCLKEYFNLNKDAMVDYDFDENKIVGLTGSQICIWTLVSGKGIFRSHEGIFSRGICMGYIDPEAVVGCDDGRAHVFDMYSGRCTRIIRMHGAPVSCLALTEDQLVLGGSNFGTVTVADLSTGEQLALLKSSFSNTGMKSLCFNSHSYLLYAGSTAGYVHCWDLRTQRSLWETRVSPNVIYSMRHLVTDSSTLAVGGLDGVLRILNQSTGEILSCFIMDPCTKLDGSSVSRSPLKIKMKGITIPADTEIHRIPRDRRPPITCLGVGLRKIVTAHNEKYLRLWRFHHSLDGIVNNS